MIFVSGSLAYDIILDYPGRFADHINPEKVHALSLSFLVRGVKKSTGGTAGNIAYNLGMLKLPVEILAAIGNDSKEILPKFTQLRIKRKYLKISKHPTAVAYIFTDRDDNQITGFYPGAMMEAVKLPKVTSGDWAIIAAENPRNMARLAKHYQRHNLKYIFDPGQAITAMANRDLRMAIRGATILIGNDYEIEYIFQKLNSPLPSPPHPSSSAGRQGEGTKTEFLPLGGGGKVGGIIIRTLGHHGSEIIYPNGKKTRIGIAQVKTAVDPTGAGDAYRAGLICGIVRGFDLKTSAQLGATAASFAVEKYGTQNHEFSYGIIVKRHNRNFKEKIQ